MKVKVNNQEMECQCTLLSELIYDLNLPEKGIAVAVDKKMVTRNRWSECTLYEGAEILVIKAVCGG